MGRPLWREVGSVVCHSQSLSQVSVYTYIKITYNVQEVNNLHTIFTRPLSVQAQYSKLCPITSSFRYNGSLVTWTVVCLTAAKFKPLVFPVSGFALYPSKWRAVYVINLRHRPCTESTVIILLSDVTVGGTTWSHSRPSINRWLLPSMDLTENLFCPCLSKQSPSNEL
jgi:hypothetical protein